MLKFNVFNNALRSSAFRVRCSIFFCLFFFALNVSAQLPPAGIWDGALHLNDSVRLPIELRLESGDDGWRLFIPNYGETFEAENVRVSKDSLSWRMPVFDTEFRTRVSGDSLSGVWINHSRKEKNVIPFKAVFPRDEMSEVTLSNYKPPLVKGRWRVVFSPGKKDSTETIALFTSVPGEPLRGTFLTETGDYRYLGGKFNPKAQTFELYTFNGAQAFVFKGKVRGSTMTGEYWSGAHWYEKFTGARNDTFQLRDPYKLTFAVDTVKHKVDFTFKDLEGKTVSLHDAKYKGKAVIIQLTGTWCPNCMDETALLAELHKKYRAKGLEIIALAYEKTTDEAKARANVLRLKNRYDAEYDFLLTGKTGRDQASASLPFLNGVMAFPTTIYIDRKGRIRKIYTGFNGPGTGAHYEQLVSETVKLIETLLAE